MPCVYNNKFVIIEQEKIVLQKDSLELGLDILMTVVDSAPGHQNQIMPRFCGAFSFGLIKFDYEKTFPLSSSRLTFD
jgi:hypothetical protein